MLYIHNLSEIEVEGDVERLVILRKRLKLSQFQFAKALGVSTSYIGQVERGDLAFPPQLRKRINNYLKQEKELYDKDLFSNL